MARILMQSRGEVRPLGFGAREEPHLCSANTAWAGVQFEMHQLRDIGDVGESGPVDGEIGLMIVTAGSYETRVRGPCGDLRIRSSAGALRVLSGDLRPQVLEIKGNAEVMAIRLTPEWLRYLSVDLKALARHAPASGGHMVCTLASAIRDEVAGGCATGRLYAESLSLSLLSYACSRLPVPQHEVPGALSAHEQELLHGYILERLDGNLGLACLAAVVGVSPRQLSARFRRTFGTTPHRYVTELRVREGARLLAAGRLDIAEIALRVGFCSQSHFTTAFRRAYGVTPRRYASGKKTVVQALTLAESADAIEPS
jgi:AraC-like DNA-binding protein